MSHTLPLVSIHLIVKDGEKYIRRCLEAVKSQTYPHVEFRVFDNASSDKTVEIVNAVMPEAEIIRFPKNYGIGGGFNRSLAASRAPYVVMLSVDVLMAPDFASRAVTVAEADKRIGAVQGKVFRYDYEAQRLTNVIDTTGLMIFRSRRVINRGHGEEDRGQYDTPGEVFCYEGAVPFFRREALEDVKIPRMRNLDPEQREGSSESETDDGAQALEDVKIPVLRNLDPERSEGSSESETDDEQREEDVKLPVTSNHLPGTKFEYHDEDFFWYAEELDLGWRLRQRGWKSWYAPLVRALHDRQTTKRLSTGWLSFIELRKTIPRQKRRLDFRNQRLAFIKNDDPVLLVKHFRHWFMRECLLFGYFLFFERSTLRAYVEIVWFLRRMLRKRRLILARRTASRSQLARWFR